MTTNENYIQAIRDCISCGDLVEPRNLPSYEVLQHTVTFDMNQPIITLAERGLDYNFMVAEAHWILRGDHLLDDHIRKNLVKYSDNGLSMTGAYGPPFVQQRDWIMDKLKEDNDTRQACMAIWHRMPESSKDIPCTVAMQWLIRGGKLHCCVFMRSQDVWIGLPYDLFNFSMMSVMILAKLNPKIGWFNTEYPDIQLGNLHITAGSRHLYDRNLEVAGDLAAGSSSGENLTIQSHKVNSPDLIMNALGDLRNCHRDTLIYNMRQKLCQ